MWSRYQLIDEPELLPCPGYGEHKEKISFQVARVFSSCKVQLTTEPTVTAACLSTHWYLQDKTLTQAKSTEAQLIPHLTLRQVPVLYRSRKPLGKQAQELSCLIMSLSCTRLNVALAYQRLTWWLVFCKLRPALFLWSGQEHLFLQHKSEHSAAAITKQSVGRPRGSSVQAASQDHSLPQPQQQSPLA